MFAYAGNSHDELLNLFRALKQSAKNDEVARGLGKNAVHKDGWGYVIINVNRVVYKRSGDPIFLEDLRPPSLSGPFLAVFHARQASPQSPTGAFFSHPFSRETLGKVLFLAHNGSISKQKLPTLGISLDYSEYVDSEAALELLEQRGIQSGVNYLKEIATGLLNLFIIEINKVDRVASLYFFNYSTQLDEYGRFYEGETSSGRFVFSSTLKLHGVDGTQAKSGELVKMADITLKS